MNAEASTSSSCRCAVRRIGSPIRSMRKFVLRCTICRSICTRTRAGCSEPGRRRGGFPDTPEPAECGWPIWHAIAPETGCAASARRSCSRRSSGGSVRSTHTFCTLRRPSPATRARCSASDGASRPTPRTCGPHLTGKSGRSSPMPDSASPARGRTSSTSRRSRRHPMSSPWCTTAWTSDGSRYG